MQTVKTWQSSRVAVAYSKCSEALPTDTPVISASKILPDIELLLTVDNPLGSVTVKLTIVSPSDQSLTSIPITSVRLTLTRRWDTVIIYAGKVTTKLDMLEVSPDT